jgi:hypothetical protein
MKISFAKRDISGRIITRILKEYNNDSYVDLSKDRIKYPKIGKIKRIKRFSHFIIHKDESSFSFLAKYGQNQARVVTVDIEFFEKVNSYIKQNGYYKIGLLTKLVPYVYINDKSGKIKNRISIIEIISGEKKPAYINFRNGNCYDYRLSNLNFFKHSAITHPHSKKKYYGVNKKGNKFRAMMMLNNSLYFGENSYDDEETAAREYDSMMMEIFGKAYSRNHPFEFYTLCDPIWIKNVSN